MNNIFHNSKHCHQVYDLKGSWIKRNKKLPTPGKKITCAYCNASFEFMHKKEVDPEVQILKNGYCPDTIGF